MLPRSSRLAAEETETWVAPSWVLSRRRAVLAALESVSGRRKRQEGSAYVSFSNVTVALCGLSAASELGVTDNEVIFPLRSV